MTVNWPWRKIEFSFALSIFSVPFDWSCHLRASRAEDVDPASTQRSCAGFQTETVANVQANFGFVANLQRYSDKKGGLVWRPSRVVN
jgi:hypothetical protein